MNNNYVTDRNVNSEPPKDKVNRQQFVGNLPSTA